MNRLYLFLCATSTLLEGSVLGAAIAALILLVTGCNTTAVRYWTPCPAGVGITGEYTKGSGTSSTKKGREGDFNYNEKTVGGYVAFDLGVDPRTCRAYVGDEANPHGSPQEDAD